MTDDPTSIPALSTTVEESFEDAPADRDDQPSIETVIASLQSRSIGEKQALLKALLDGGNEVPLAPHGASTARHDVMPLPGLKPPATEKAGYNLTDGEDSIRYTDGAPLPGTISAQVSRAFLKSS